MKKTDLLAMAVDELKALARKMKVVLPVRAKKAEIIDALMTAARAGEKAIAKKNPVKKAKTQNVTAKETIAKKAAAKKETTKKAIDNQKVTKKAAPAKATTKTVKSNLSTAKKSVAKARKITVPGRTPVRRLPDPIIPIHDWKIPPESDEPHLAQERAAESKYYTGSEGQQAAASSGILPQGYGEDRIVLIVRDPFVVHAYWEATPERIKREKAWFGWESKLCIRIFDVTGVQFDGKNAIGYFDQEVIERTGNWYLDLGRPGHSFCADLGLLSPEGRFLSLVRSNYITIPRDDVSDVLDEEWMIPDEVFRKLYGYEGFEGGPSSHRRGSQEWELMRRRRLQEISSPGLVARERTKTRRK